MHCIHCGGELIESWGIDEDGTNILIHLETNDIWCPDDELQVAETEDEIS